MYKLNDVVRNIVSNKEYIVCFIPSNCFHSSASQHNPVPCYGLMSSDKTLWIIPKTEVESSIYKLKQ
jgi:hypothetical protein